MGAQRARSALTVAAKSCGLWNAVVLPTLARLSIICGDLTASPIAAFKAPTISAVAQTLGMTHQNVKQIAAALERKGFLDIVVDTVDRRARRLQLTAHHHRFWKARNPSDFSSVEAWTSALTDAEVATVVRLLNRLKDQLHSPARTPGP